MIRETSALTEGILYIQFQIRLVTSKQIKTIDIMFLHENETDTNLISETDTELKTEYLNIYNYYVDDETTTWLQANYTNKTTEQIIESSDVKASKGIFAWPIPGYTTITSHYGMRVHPITRCI